MTENERLDGDALPTLESVRVHPGLRENAPSGCLDEAALAAFVSGGTGAHRTEVLAHLTVCARCRHAVAMLSRVLTDARIASEIRGAPGAGWSRRAGWTVGIAAAATIAFILLRPSRPDELAPGSELREPPITAVGSPTLIAPRGGVAAAPGLLWSHVPRAERYRLRLYDSTGTALWEKETTDTMATVPSTLRFAHGATYFWKVEAKTGRSRWVASDLVQFTIVASP